MSAQAFLSKVVIGAALGAASCPAAAMTWDFRVLLDGKPIGDHRFTVTTHGPAREVESDAHYEVKMLGLTVYHYTHHASERWRDDCLQSLEAQTDDNGTRTDVAGRADGSAFDWQVAGTDVPKWQRVTCPMTFAYWNPAISDRDTLLDPGSGRLVRVHVQPLALSIIDVHGTPSTVRGLRIEGLKSPIDVWYLGDAWVGLDTTVEGGRTLQYRLP